MDRKEVGKIGEELVSLSAGDQPGEKKGLLDRIIEFFNPDTEAEVEKYLEHFDRQCGMVREEADRMFATLRGMDDDLVALADAVRERQEATAKLEELVEKLEAVKR